MFLPSRYHTGSIKLIKVADCYERVFSCDSLLVGTQRNQTLESVFEILSFSCPQIKPTDTRGKDNAIPTTMQILFDFSSKLYISFFLLFIFVSLFISFFSSTSLVYLKAFPRLYLKINSLSRTF